MTCSNDRPQAGSVTSARSRALADLRHQTPLPERDEARALLNDLPDLLDGEAKIAGEAIQIDHDDDVARSHLREKPCDFHAPDLTLAGS